ncbi:pyridoxamine 5'-phosphate oxidase family protein [Cupriavidus sp. a3]|uniref:pyridoxamine 5'-phosphate oxidase family protein n=1 Tax=Cupriavidus sp. a3 TaxID=3242158 RepID=UPI003D9C1BA5
MDANLKHFMLDLIESGRDLSLATLRDDGYPQANIVSYASDGLTLYFGTARASTKLRNILHCNRVSLTISAPYDGWNDIRALSMAGVAHVLPDDSPESAHAMQCLRSKFPSGWDMSPPGEPTQIVFVAIVSVIASVLDYAQGFGHSELVAIGSSDLGSPAEDS